LFFIKFNRKEDEKKKKELKESIPATPLPSANNSRGKEVDEEPGSKSTPSQLNTNEANNTEKDIAIALVKTPPVIDNNSKDAPKSNSKENIPKKVGNPGEETKLALAKKIYSSDMKKPKKKKVTKF